MLYSLYTRPLLESCPTERPRQTPSCCDWQERSPSTSATFPKSAPSTPGVAVLAVRVVLTGILFSHFPHCRSHEKPHDPDDPLNKQNVKDRFEGRNDPVAAKILERVKREQREYEREKREVDECTMNTNV